MTLIRFEKLSGLAAVAGFALATGFLSMPAWAQQDQVSAAELSVQLGVSVFFFLLFGVILLAAKRDMKGWSQPITFVWFAFTGRLNRKAYWLKGVLPVNMIAFVLQVFSGLAGLGLGGGIGTTLVGMTLLVVFVPYIVFSIWVGLALTIKRFHDLGSSGWWVFGFLIPFYNIWLAIKLMFFRGDVGPNRFGPDPIDPVSDYIDELTGSGGGGEPEHGEGGAEEQPPPRPRPPADDPPEVKGFGSRKFSKPVQAAPAKPEPEHETQPVDVAGGADQLDVIKRRLGDDIMRPIKRKGGGGREAEG